MKLFGGLFSFTPTNYPKPDPQNYAFSQNTTLPFFDVRGRGRLFTNQLMFSAPQVITTNVVTPKGLGGLFQGQMVSQALSEPPQDN